MRIKVLLLAGVLFCIGSPLLAAPVEITTEEGLSQLLEHVCRLLAPEQTPSHTVHFHCARLRERLHRELRERLHEHGSVVIDPEILAESMYLSLQWLEVYPRKWGFEEATQLVLGLTELAKQYGEELRDFLAQAKAAGYSPEELVGFVTRLAQNVTKDSPAEEALEEILDSVEALVEGTAEEEDHGKAREKEHGPSYKEGHGSDKGKAGDEEDGRGKGGQHNGKDQDRGSKGQDDGEDEDHGNGGHDHDDEDGDHGGEDHADDG